MRTIILCLGNQDVADDGIGARIGSALQSLPLPESIRVEIVPRMRLELLDELAEVDHLVIVDGLTADAEPGTSTIVDVTQHSAAVVASGCCHPRDVRDIIHTARDVAPEGSECTITIAGVRVARSDSYGAGFSQAVLSASPRIVDLLLLTTGAPLNLRLLAAEVLHQNERPERGAFALREWPEVHFQTVGLQ